MPKSHRFSLLLPVMVIALILSSLIPSPVLAGDDPPTPAATPDAVVPPEGPTQEPLSSSNSDGGSPLSAEDNPASQNGTEVVVTADGGDKPSSQLMTKLPIWCPSGVEPIPGENGCTAEFGSISLLMDYINTNNLGTDGSIWISDPTQPNNTDTPSEQAQADVGTTDNSDGVSETTNGVNIIILDTQGDSLPLNSEEGVNALLNGQPVWCPDGTMPSDGGEGCTSSSASLGLLVSMMENSSNVNGAIYIQSEAGQNADNNPASDAEGQNINVDIAAISALQGADGTNADGQIENQNIAVDPALAVVVDESLSSVDGQVETRASLPDPVLNDPIWCSNAVLAPDPLDPLCTPSQPDLLTLVSYLMLPGNEPAAAGTIWMEKGPPNDGSSGNIVIDGTVFPSWRNYSLTLQGGWSGIAGDPSITGLTTFSQAISVTNWLNNVSVSDIVVQNTTSTGLNVLTTGNIGLNNITSTGNALDGVFVHNDIAGTGNVTVTGTNNISNNLDDGLIIRSKGDITTNQITATGNGDVGAYYRNDTGTGNILLTGANIFSNNGGNIGGAYHNGLKLDTTGSININNITASNNFMGGTDFGTSTGPVTLTGVNSFVGNGGVGLDISISNGGSIDLQNVTATNNASYGASLVVGAGAGSGLVNISGTNVFNNNSSAGLTVSTYGDIVLSNIDASANMGSADGAKFGTACNITINSSTFNNNAGYGFDDGLALPAYPASIALNGVTFSGNGLGNYLINNPLTVVPATSSYPCTNLGNSSFKAVLTQPIVLPLNTVSMSGLGDSNVVGLNCTEFSGTVLVLANGDQVKYMCPTLGQASLIHVEEGGENFPGGLPVNLVFTSAMETHLSEAGIDQPLTPGDLIVSFVIPVDIAGFDFAILYFDGSNWLDLSTAAFSDGKLVSNGGFKTENGMFEAITNFTGLFVLVRK